MNVLFYIAIMLFAGLLFGRLAKLVHLPNVTGYLVAGLVLGPYLIGVIPKGTVDSLGILSEIALGFIAVSIGSGFKFSYFRRVGASPIIIAIFEGVMAIIVVAAVLIICGFDLSLSLLLGAIASATAPAATIMVVRQYQAKGPVTETLLSVVALDDAVALVGFGFAVAAVKAMQNPASNVAMSIVQPFIDVGISFLVGIVLGFLLSFPYRWFRKDSNRLCVIIGSVFLTVALSQLFGGSSLLSCMALGATLTNVTRATPRVMAALDKITPPIFMLFFVVSGASLDVTVLPSIGVIGIIYLFARVAGKMGGAWLGATISKAPQTVRKYLGGALIPQAGVAIGLIILAGQIVPDYAPTIRAVVLCATLIYELTGPGVTKFMLTKAGEIAPQKKRVKAEAK